MISEHATQWLGYPVELFDSQRAQSPVKDCAGRIYRLALDWDAEMDFPTLFSKFISNPGVSEAPAIIIGQHHGEDPSGSSEEVVQLLVSARDRLPNLRGIFMPDVISEENEISWINQCDVSPLLETYPALEHLRLRGATALSLGGKAAHANLKSLTIESGGMPSELLREVLASQFPALEHLELWLGTDSYGGDVTVNDLQALFKGNLFPNLKYLGLRDSEIVNEIAKELAAAPILQKIEILDLSLGTLSDEGGKALLQPGFRHLKHVDLHHHYLSEKMMSQLQQAFKDINLDDEQDEDADDRYVAVGE